MVPILTPEDLLFQLVLATPLGFASWCASPGDEQWDLPRERENISHRTGNGTSVTQVCAENGRGYVSVREFYFIFFLDD